MSTGIRRQGFCLRKEEINSRKKKHAKIQNVENSNDCKEHNENLNILEVEDLNSPPNLKEHISHASKYQARHYVKKCKRNQSAHSAI